VYLKTRLFLFVAQPVAYHHRNRTCFQIDPKPPAPIATGILKCLQNCGNHFIFELLFERAFKTLSRPKASVDLLVAGETPTGLFRARYIFP
jgi:hypothetical protein